MDTELKAGDLTVTDDGYYGIVKDPKERTIMLANGLTQIVDEEEWSELRPLPLQEGAESPANFFEFLLISQQETIFNYRRMLSWYIDHVGQCEGVTFLADRFKPKELTDQEWEELQEMARTGFAISR
jgi:hypothetical protein